VIEGGGSVMAISLGRKRYLKELLRRESQGDEVVELQVTRDLSMHESEFVDELRTKQLMAEEESMGNGVGNNVFVVKNKALEGEVLELKAEVQRLKRATSTDPSMMQKLEEALRVSEEEKRVLSKNIDLKKILIEKLSSNKSEWNRKLNEKNEVIGHLQMTLTDGVATLQELDILRKEHPQQFGRLSKLESTVSTSKQKIEVSGRLYSELLARFQTQATTLEENVKTKAKLPPETEKNRRRTRHCRKKIYFDKVRDGKA
jgi:hypothetical protein